MQQVATKNSPELGSVSVEVSNYVRRKQRQILLNICQHLVAAAKRL